MKWFLVSFPGRLQDIYVKSTDEESARELVDDVYISNDRFSVSEEEVETADIEETDKSSNTTPKEMVRGRGREPFRAWDPTRGDDGEVVVMEKRVNTMGTDKGVYRMSYARE